MAQPPYPPGLPSGGFPPAPGFVGGAPPPPPSGIPPPPTDAQASTSTSGTEGTKTTSGIPEDKQPLNTVPCRTVYVSNLNEKVKLNVLKTTLRNLFKPFGEVLDVTAHKNIRMRGQAFVAFPDEESAAKAIKDLQHFTLYEKPMVLQFARNKSDVHAVNDGDIDDHKNKRQRRKEEVRQTPLPGSHKPTFRASNKAPRLARQPRINIPEENLPPNKILFLQALPDTITHEYLTQLFQGFPGFKEVRTIEMNKSIAFVEYEDESFASMAKMQLSDYQLDPEHTLKVSYALK